MSSTFPTIDQLIIAAQLLERKNAIQNVIIAGATDNSNNKNGINPLNFKFRNADLSDFDAFTSFGEGYKEKLFSPKIRPALIETAVVTDRRPSAFTSYPINSAGTSRRSSPLSTASPGSPSSSYSVPSSVSPCVMVPHPAVNITTVMEPVAIATTGSSCFLAPLEPQKNTTNSNCCRIPAIASSSSTRQSRAAHNELEKNRRANLRSYLNSLKEVLPVDPECSRDTTLSLLTRARNYIRLSQAQKVSLTERRDTLLREQQNLLERTKSHQSCASESTTTTTIAQNRYQQQQQTESIQCNNDGWLGESKPPNHFHREIIVHKQKPTDSGLPTENQCASSFYSSSTLPPIPNNKSGRVTAASFDDQQPYHSHQFGSENSTAAATISNDNNSNCLSSTNCGQQTKHLPPGGLATAGPYTKKISDYSLYMNGLLMALPLIYPYSTNTVSENSVVDR